MTTLARQPVRISEDLYNDILRTIEEVAVAERREDFEKLANRLQAVITIEDECIDGDGSGLCETHNYLPMAYYVDMTGKLLKRGTFDPEEEGFPVCEDAQRYSEKLAAKYNR
jgi:hypothetical protein